jgi:RNase P/RNase MRP subunit POP5
MESKIPVEKIRTERPQPVLVHFYDNISESQDEVITPGGGARITGSLLKFDEADVQQGIFFVNVASGEAVRVATKLLRNKPGELIFVAPALVTGTYRAEVRAILHKSTKIARIGALPYELTVA